VDIIDGAGGADRAPRKENLPNWSEQIKGAVFEAPPHAVTAVFPPKGKEHRKENILAAERGVDPKQKTKREQKKTRKKGTQKGLNKGEKKGKKTRKKKIAKTSRAKNRKKEKREGEGRRG